MLQRLTNGSVKLVERYLPDPYVLVLLLSTVVFVAAIAFEGQSPLQMVQYWGDGFWNLLTFAMQMVLVLVTGFVLASTPFFRTILKALAPPRNNNSTQTHTRKHTTTSSTTHTTAAATHNRNTHTNNNNQHTQHTCKHTPTPTHN